MRQGWGGDIVKAHTPGLATYKQEDYESQRTSPNSERSEPHIRLQSGGRGGAVCTKMSSQNV